jgi:hypothetical protein
MIKRFIGWLKTLPQRFREQKMEADKYHMDRQRERRKEYSNAKERLEERGKGKLIRKAAQYLERKGMI